jgi:hypothetical protein
MSYGSYDSNLKLYMMMPYVLVLIVPLHDDDDDGDDGK